jgi:hypothetical protein
VTTLVHQYLSEYIEDFDKHQIGLHPLTGEIRLENLTLKRSALQRAGLHLPLELEFGYIGLLWIRWDWLQLLSKPLLVELRDVMIVLREKSVEEAQSEVKAVKQEEVEKQMDQKKHADPLEEAKKHHAELVKAKQARLAQAEEFRLAPEVQKESAPGFLKKILYSIIDNIQIHVRHLHVRYEHRPVHLSAGSSNPLGYNASVGVVLTELTVSSTDSEWNTTFVEGAESTHKLVDMSNLFIYCNTRESDQSASITTPDSLRNIFQHLMPPPREVGAGDESVTSTASDESYFSTGSPTSLSYGLNLNDDLQNDPLCELLLHPVNLCIRATVRYKDAATRSANVPMVSAQILLPLFEVSVCQRQVRSLQAMGDNLKAVNDRLSVLKSDHEEQLTERSGTKLERECYIALYKRTLSLSWEKTLSVQEGEELQQMEEVILTDELNEWRICACAELVAEVSDHSRSCTLRPLFGQYRLMVVCVFLCSSFLRCLPPIRRTT